MIHNFSGIDSEFLLGGGGGGGVEGTLCFKACGDESSFFSFLNKKDRSSLQYFITQRMGQSSMFFTFRTVCNFGGRTWALGRVGGGRGRTLGLNHSLYEACLKT